MRTLIDWIEQQTDERKTEEQEGESVGASDLYGSILCH